MSRPGRAGSSRSWWRAVARVVARPVLWPTAARVAGRVARDRWWRRPPFLPLPDHAYLRFRLETQYGADGAPSPDDLVSYLEWCKEMERRRGRTAGTP